jgi:hypothetical protein
MAVSRVKTSSILQGFPKSRSLLAGNAGYDPAATWLIQRTTLTSNTATITFSSIPSIYKSLQLRYIARSTTTGSTVGDNIFINLNSDTGANYTYHQLLGNGSTVSATGATAQTKLNFQNALPRNTVTASIFGVGVLDLLDYASTTKNKTARIFYGTDVNGTEGKIYLASGLWINTTAVTSITLAPQSNSFLSGSTFALYGMVG